VARNDTKKPDLTASDIARMAELDEQIKASTAELTELKDRAKKQFKPGKYALEHDGENYELDLTEKRGTLNKVLFQRDFPADDFGDLYQLEPNSAAVLEALGEDGQAYFGKTVALAIRKARTTE